MGHSMAFPAGAHAERTALAAEDAPLQHPSAHTYLKATNLCPHAVPAVEHTSLWSHSPTDQALCLWMSLPYLPTWDGQHPRASLGFLTASLLESCRAGSSMVDEMATSNGFQRGFISYSALDNPHSTRAHWTNCTGSFLPFWPALPRLVLRQSQVAGRTLNPWNSLRTPTPGLGEQKAMREPLQEEQRPHRTQPGPTATPLRTKAVVPGRQAARGRILPGEGCDSQPSLHLHESPHSRSITATETTLQAPKGGKGSEKPPQRPLQGWELWAHRDPTLSPAVWGCIPTASRGPRQSRHQERSWGIRPPIITTRLGSPGGFG